MSEQGQGRGKKSKGRGKKGRGARGRGSQQQTRNESVPGGLQQREQQSQGATALPEKEPRTKEAKQSTLQQEQTQPPKKQQPTHQPDTTDGAGPSKVQKQPSTSAQSSARPEARHSPSRQSDVHAKPLTQNKPSNTALARPTLLQHPQSPPGATKPDVPQQTQLVSTQQPQSQPPSGAAKPVKPQKPSDSPPHSDRVVPKPPRRPDGGGKSGRLITLRANFLPVELPENDVHHYDTEISAKGVKSGQQCCTKSEAPRIIKEVVSIYEKENPSGPKLAYDRNGKNIYCRIPIPGIGKDRRKYMLPFVMDNGKEREYTIEVKWVGEVSLYHLKEALKGKHTEIPQDTLQAIEVVLQQMPKMRTIQIRRSFFDYPTGREKDIGGGLQMWNGTFLSIRPTQWKMMLNVDTCATAFYKAQPVLDLMMQVLFSKPRDVIRKLNDKQRKKFAKEIKGLKVETTHRRRKQKANGLSIESAREKTFDCEGKQISVMNFFKKTYGITLKYPDLPCVKIGQKSLIPIELCRVVEHQRKEQKLSGEQTAEMIKHTAIPAPERMKKIQELIHKLHHQEDPYLRDFQIIVGNDMATIQGRVLEPPLLIFGPKNRPAQETPRDGAWKTQKRMLDPQKLVEWALISYINDDPSPKRPKKYYGPDYLDKNGINHFVECLVDVGREKGLHINRSPRCAETAEGFLGTEKLFGDLKTRYPDLQLVIVVLPIDGDNFYEEVKICGDVIHGLITQCIKVEKASNDFSDWRQRETLVNLCYKINAKLGGTTCALDKGIKSQIFKRPVIIFGADVTHPGVGEKSPSIAAVVASKDSGPTLYNAEVRVQTVKRGHEMIEDLKEMVKTLLIKFRASTKGAIPEKIIFYRDGVGEGQFREVLTDELYAIQKACTDLKEDYQPHITFIVVQKRHHVRFFAKDPNEQKGKSKNIPAGTLVDQKVCHPYEFNWYLCSHAGIQGTSRPALYHVLYDDSNFTSDDLQILTNQLCYTYVRCARSVSIPAPAYYAHHVAFRAKHHLKSVELGSVASDDSGQCVITPEMKAKIEIHPNVKCSMYFA